MGFGKDGKGVIIRESRNQTIGTLGAGVALIVGTKLATLERFRIIKAELIASVFGATAGDQNAMFVGLADGDLTVAEIEAAIEANGPLGPNDRITMAIAERPAWWFGVTEQEPNADPRAFKGRNGSPVMEETIRWTFARTKSWNWFVYNMGEAPTTGATVRIRSKLFGVWVT